MPLNYQHRRHHHHCFQHHHHPYHHHSTSYHHPQRVKMTRWGLSHPLPPATPATSTPNKSLRLVGASLSLSTCDTSHIKPQRVITTRWGLSLALHLRRQPHQAPTSHYNSLGALSPPPPATPATSTPNESLRLVGGSLSPSTCDASPNDPQRVIATRGYGITVSTTCDDDTTSPSCVDGPLSTTSVDDDGSFGSCNRVFIIIKYKDLLLRF